MLILFKKSLLFVLMMTHFRIIHFSFDSMRKMRGAHFRSELFYGWRHVFDVFGNNITKRKVTPLLEISKNEWRNIRPTDFTRIQSLDYNWCSGASASLGVLPQDVL